MKPSDVSLRDLYDADLRTVDPDVRDRAAHTTIAGDTLTLTITPKPLQLDYRSNPWGALGKPPVKPEGEHRNLSQDQLDYLDRALGDVPALLADLEVAVTKQHRFPAAPVPPTDGTESPLPYSGAATDALQQLIRAVCAAAELLWHRLTSGNPWRFRDAHEAAQWLQATLDKLATDPAAEELYGRITTATGRAHKIIDRPPGHRYLGDCPGCRTDLYALEDDEYVTCDSCDWASPVQDILDRAVTEGRDMLFTDTELIGAVVAKGKTVTRRRIQYWADRGRLTVHEQKRWKAGRIVSVRTFRLGDVLDLVDELDARQVS